LRCSTCGFQQLGKISANQAGKRAGSNAGCKDDAESRYAIFSGSQSCHSWRKANSPGAEGKARQKRKADLSGHPKYKCSQNAYQGTGNESCQQRFLKAESSGQQAGGNRSRDISQCERACYKAKDVLFEMQIRQKQVK